MDEGQTVARLWKALQKIGGIEIDKLSPEEAADKIQRHLDSSVTSRLEAAERALARRHIDAELEARAAQQARDALGKIAVNRRDRIVELEAAFNELRLIISKANDAHGSLDRAEIIIEQALKKGTAQ